LHGFSVSDGDTVKFGKQRIRLFGIDAPEKAQHCDDASGTPVRWRRRLSSTSLPAAQ
jgi:endonuclease YncB( thermonuclease family)